LLVAFDLDGTVVDSLRDITEAASALSCEAGGRPLDEAAVSAMVGDGAAELVARIFVRAGRAEVASGAVDRYLELYRARMLTHTRAYPGIPEALSALCPRHALALLTNKPRASSERILNHLGLAPRFVHAIYGDGPVARKPSPDGLRDLMRATAAAPGSTLLVGDSAVDLATGRAAGTHVCLVRYGFGFGHIPPGQLRGTERIADHPADIVAIVETLERLPLT
jgi:phosphoglycolate phosphatase